MHARQVHTVAAFGIHPKKHCRGAVGVFAAIPSRRPTPPAPLSGGRSDHPRPLPPPRRTEALERAMATATSGLHATSRSFTPPPCGIQPPSCARRKPSRGRDSAPRARTHAARQPRSGPFIPVKGMPPLAAVRRVQRWYHDGGSTVRPAPARSKPRPPTRPRASTNQAAAADGPWTKDRALRRATDAPAVGKRTLLPRRQAAPGAQGSHRRASADPCRRALGTSARPRRGRRDTMQRRPVPCPWRRNTCGTAVFATSVTAGRCAGRHGALAAAELSRLRSWTLVPEAVDTRPRGCELRLESFA